MPAGWSGSRSRRRARGWLLRTIRCWVETVRTGPSPVLLDARWVGKGGTGTFTISLLQGLGEVVPPEPWLIWGPPSVARCTWPGATFVATSVDPAAWAGQRAAMRVPGARMVVHPHQTRPLHLFPAASCVLDLIQMQHPSAAIRALMTVRLTAVVRVARVLFTISGSVKSQLAGRFGIDPGSVTVLPVPVDAAAAGRVAAQRASSERSGRTDRYVLSVGRFARHKNYRRLVDAFGRTRFAASGGLLHLVGGTRAQLDVGDGPLPPGVRVLGMLDAAGLEAQMAGALALVHPSLAEGYGLPVAEALAAHVPVVSSPIPALVEYGPSGVPLFDPTSVPGMSEAIDETLELVEAERYWKRVDLDPWLHSQPTPRALATRLLRALEVV